MKTNLLSQSTLRLLFFVMLLSIPFLAQAQDTTDLSDTEEMNNDCATDNPFLLSFVQSAINNNLVGCTVPNGLQQIEYNDAIYYKITQGLPLLSVPLPCGGFLPITDIRDCNGFTVCTWTAAGIGLNPDFCSDFLDDSLPETTLWGNNHLGPINTPGTFDVTACVGDEIEMFLYLPKEHFSPTSAPSGFFESGPAGPDGPGGAPSEILAPLTNQSEINTGTMDLSEAIDENGALLLDGFLEEDGLLTIGVNGAGSITYNLDIIVYALGEPFERTVSWTINVSLEDGCGETNTVPNPPIFADYPWLNEVINPNDCDGTVVEVYSQGIYEFIYIQTPTGNTFYFQDGTFYCADAPNFSCVAAYGLTNMVTTWTCGNIPESPNTIFTNYWWLNDIVAEDYCTFTPEITVYESGGYHFIYVAGLDGIGTLYFEDGTLYCTDAPNYSCVTAYGFDQVINTWTCESEYDLTAYDEILYICPGDSVTMFPQYPCDSAGPESFVNQGISEDSVPDHPMGVACFPSPYGESPIGPGGSIVSWTVNEETITNYTNTSYTVSPMESTVYTANFMTTCSAPYGNPNDPPSAPLAPSSTETKFLIIVLDGIDCALGRPAVDNPIIEQATMSLGLPGNIKRETGLVEANGEHVINNFYKNESIDKLLELSFKVFPNPSNGRIFVEIENTVESEQIITVYDLSGRTMQQITVEPYGFDTKVELNLNDVPNGVYLVELKTEFASEMKRLVVNK